MTKFTFIFCTILDIFNDDPFCLLYEEFMVQNRLYHNKLLEKFILLFDDTHGVYIDGKGRRTRRFIFSACYLFSSFDSSLPPLTNSLHHATVFFFSIPCCAGPTTITRISQRAFAFSLAFFHSLVSSFCLPLV